MYSSLHRQVSSRTSPTRLSRPGCSSRSSRAPAGPKCTVAHAGSQQPGCRHPPIAPEARGCALCMGQVKRLCGVAAGCGGALARSCRRRFHCHRANYFIIPSIIQEPSAQRCRLHRRDPTLHGRRAHILHWLVPAAPVAHDAHCTEDEDRRYLTTGAQSMT